MIKSLTFQLFQRVHWHTPGTNKQLCSAVYDWIIELCMALSEHLDAHNQISGQNKFYHSSLKYSTSIGKQSRVAQHSKKGVGHSPIPLISNQTDLFTHSLMLLFTDIWIQRIFLLLPRVRSRWNVEIPKKHIWFTVLHNGTSSSHGT